MRKIDGEDDAWIDRMVKPMLRHGLTMELERLEGNFQTKIERGLFSREGCEEPKRNFNRLGFCEQPKRERKREDGCMFQGFW